MIGIFIQIVQISVRDRQHSQRERRSKRVSSVTPQPAIITFAWRRIGNILDIYEQLIIDTPVIGFRNLPATFKVSMAHNLVGRDYIGLRMSEPIECSQATTCYHYNCQHNQPYE